MPTNERLQVTEMLTTLNDRQVRLDAPPGPLGRLASVAYRRRGRVLVAWALGLAAALALSASFGGEYATDYSAPDSDSQQAVTLLQERFPAQSGDPVDVVIRADDVTSAAVRGEVDALLGELNIMPHVAAVEDPYATEGSISPDGRTVVARMYLDVANPNDMPVEDTERLLATAEAAERDGVEIALGGQAVRLAEEGEVGSEMIGWPPQP